MSACHSGAGGLPELAGAAPHSGPSMPWFLSSALSSLLLSKGEETDEAQEEGRAFTTARKSCFSAGLDSPGSHHSYTFKEKTQHLPR